MSPRPLNLNKPSNYSGRGPRLVIGQPETIVDEIARLMKDHNELDARSIRVDVSGGTVKLHGRLQNKYMLNVAVGIAQSIRGVDEVIWNVHFSNGQMASGDTHGGGKPPD